MPEILHVIQPAVVERAVFHTLFVSSSFNILFFLGISTSISGYEEYLDYDGPK